MTDSQLLDRVQLIFRECLDNDSLRIDAHTTPANLPAWDSMAQVTLVMSLEKEFDLYLTAKEIGSLDSVQAILDLVRAKHTAPAPGS